MKMFPCGAKIKQFVSNGRNMDEGKSVSFAWSMNKETRDDEGEGTGVRTDITNSVSSGDVLLWFEWLSQNAPLFPVEQAI